MLGVKLRRTRETNQFFRPCFFSLTIVPRGEHTVSPSPNEPAIHWTGLTSAECSCPFSLPWPLPLALSPCLWFCEPQSEQSFFFSSSSLIFFASSSAAFSRASSSFASCYEQQGMNQGQITHRSNIGQHNDKKTVRYIRASYIGGNDGHASIKRTITRCSGIDGTFYTVQNTTHLQSKPRSLKHAGEKCDSQNTTCTQVGVGAGRTNAMSFLSRADFSYSIPPPRVQYIATGEGANIVRRRDAARPHSILTS